jgi:putative ATPase
MDASRDAKGFGHGQGYQYPHSFPGHFTPQQYLPTALLGRVFYQPSDQGYEARIAERLAQLREASAQVLGDKPTLEKNDHSSTDPARGK